MPYQKPKPGDVIVFTHLPDWWDDACVTVGKEYLIGQAGFFYDDEEDERFYPQSEEAWEEGVVCYIVQFSLENE